RGVGRLALETGVPVVPIAVTGSENARRGWKIRPAKVKIRLGRPLTFPRVENRSPRLAAEVSARLWPCAELPWGWRGGLAPLRAAVAQVGARIGQRSALLVLSKGLVPPLGLTPTRYVSERTPARAVGALGGPAHAAEAVRLGASVVLASSDADFRAQFSKVLGGAGLDVETTD